jgi:hypothetical protein
MNPPKHLWSGDWERESDSAPQVRPAPTPPAAPPPPEDPPRHRRRRPPLAALVAFLVLLITAGVVLALTLPGGSSTPANPRTTAQFTPRPFGGGTGGAPLQGTTTPSQQQPPSQPTTPQQPTTATATPQPSQVQVGPTYTWLGMQVSATPSGVAVATVTIGGAADSDGVNPGDVITQINQTEIGSIAELQAAVKNLQLGTRFQIVVDRGSTPVTISATLTNRPKRSS